MLWHLKHRPRNNAKRNHHHTHAENGHDLGHGPMSHMYDGKFLPRMRERFGGVQIEHEIISTQMLDLLIETNGLMPYFELEGLTKQDIVFIKEMIDHQARGASMTESSISISN